VLHHTPGLRGIEPVCLCIPHFKEWKSDPRSSNRIKEENAKISARLKSTNQHPRNPEGWQLDAEDLVHEIHQKLDSIRLDVPFMTGLENNDCLRKLKSLNTFKEMLVNIEDEARAEYYLRGMKRPAGVAFNPDQESETLE
jgi:hypothetical protein